ncbi:MAG TPA: SRPBCC family protein [Blastocatellia bacterium]|nr:SRPBCC family protein [Blastocatellia bacterium]
MSKNEKAAQVATAAAGAALAFYGFRKGGVTGAIVGVMGAGIATQTLASVAGVPIISASAPREVRDVIEVAASREQAYATWSRMEDFPRFMPNVCEVRKTGDRTYHWSVEGPLGQRIEWEAEVTHDLPGRLIAWKSVTAEVSNSGEVRFEETRHGARVFVTMRYGLPAGPIGALVARLTRSDPKAMVRQDLRRFKQMIEAGPSNSGVRRGQFYEPEKMRFRETTAR